MLHNLNQSINATVEQFIEENCKEGNREQTGLDTRAFGKFWYCYEGIFIFAGNRRSLDYYGGFEYIDSGPAGAGPKSMYSKPHSLTGPGSGREFSGRARDLGLKAASIRQSP